MAIGAGVLVVVFLFYFLITRGNPPKDVLFFGNEHGFEPFRNMFPNAPTLQLNPPRCDILQADFDISRSFHAENV